ncbi:MAG: hypothetical protein CR997_06420 [Acidobacteria bacterium]|nr:MAG: hypothetical protein CR997_06420 [Acidobacteriota bacterium]
MITFKKAIDIAKRKVEELIPNSKNISLEGVLISDDKRLYEVSLSYDLRGDDSFDSGNHEDANLGGGLASLVKVMSYRRHCKKFLIDYKNGEFRGFKNED